jgi:predicted TIM-barrel fold metal-dependent hydrolase
MQRINSRRRREFLALSGAALLDSAANAHLQTNSAKRYRVIDTHLHVFNSKLQGRNGIPKYMPDSTVEYHLELMDRGGVDKAFLISYNAEDIGHEIRNRGHSPVVVLPVINRKYQVESWKAHKDRFWWFYGHGNPLHEDVDEDLKRAFEMGCSGLKGLPLFHGLLPDHPGFQPLYDLCQKHKKPIILDVSWWYLGKYVGYGTNETRERQDMVKSFESYADYARLMDPIFDKYSTLPFSMAHCGTAKAYEDYEHILPMINRHPNVSCDLAAILDYSPKFIEELVKAVGAKKIMYGTDAPYWYKGPDSFRTGARRWTLIAEECPFLSDQEKQAILAGNAERFVKGLLPA